MTWRDLLDRARELAGLHGEATSSASGDGRPPPAAARPDPAPAETQPWTLELVRAEGLAARGEHAAAARVLATEVERLRAEALDRDRLLASTLAHLARAEAAAGDTGGATARMAEALEAWRRLGDHDGVVAALESLVVLERRADDVSAAARDARALAVELEAAGEFIRAQRYGALARDLASARRAGG